jgi:hypothetical protein
MRNKLLVCIALAAALVLLVAVVVGAVDRRDRDIISYNVLAERMFRSIVASQVHIIEGVMYFTLRTAYNTLEVQIGPKEFVERSSFKLNPGDEVTVISGCRSLWKSDKSCWGVKSAV